MSKEQSNNFAELLKAINETGDEADEMSKPAPAAGEASQDDKTIQAASVDSNDEDKDKDGKADMTKSLTVTGADGKVEEVIDATDMIKSLQDQVAEHDTVLAKALGDIGGILKAQNTLIKSLQTGMAELAGQGRGRRAVFSTVEKPGVGGDLAKSQGAAADAGMSTGDFFAKAEVANAKGKLSGHELNTISVCIRMGQDIDPNLIRKVALASA